MKRIVILGGGTGGTLTANRLRRSYDEQAAEIVVVDHDADHVYQPGLLFVPFGLTSMQRIVRPRRQQFRSGISFRQAGVVDGVDKRIDVIATAIRAGLTVDDLADLDLAYSPPFGSAKDPVNLAGMVASNLLTGTWPCGAATTCSTPAPRQCCWTSGQLPSSAPATYPAR